MGIELEFDLTVAVDIKGKEADEILLSVLKEKRSYLKRTAPEEHEGAGKKTDWLALMCAHDFLIDFYSLGVEE